MNQANLRKISLGLIFLNRKKKVQKSTFFEANLTKSKDTAGKRMFVAFQRCLPFFLLCLRKKVTNIFTARKRSDYLSILKLNRKRKKISPTEKVVNEHEKMLARAPQECTTTVHTCEKHCRLLGCTPEHVNNNFSWPPWPS